MLVKTNNFSEIKSKVAAIKQTENSYLVKNMNSAKRRNLLDVAKYSGYGLSAAGVRLGFPASFVGKYGSKHPDGAKKILTDCYEDFFEKLSSSERQDDKVDGRKSTALFVRDFDDVHCGILTDKYSVFDDDEVVDILSKNNYLMNAEEFWYNVSPERFHARFVSSNKLSVDGDPSPLYELTKDQKDILNQFVISARKGKRVNALVQGDVGSGKTICAILLMVSIVNNGYQAVLMAPTGILAKQHYEEMVHLQHKEVKMGRYYHFMLLIPILQLERQQI